MQMLKFWVRPAIIVLAWIVAAAFTLTELATVVPSLTATGVEPAQARPSRPRTVGARLQVTTRAAVAP